MSRLFETSEINGMRLANRFVRSATWEGMAADDGACTPQFKDLYTRLAKGGVGLIITSHTYVRTDGKGTPRQLGIDKDEHLEGLQEFTRAIHAYDSRVAVEISHAGILTNEKLTGQIPLVVSAVHGYGQSSGKEMTVEDIEDIGDAFAQAARRAKQAGFDAVQIHAAHGFLMSQFLSSAFNKRTDAYGGPLENRARALLEVLRKIRASVGSDFPVLIKLNSQDVLDEGLTLEDSVQVGLMLQETGIDAIELSGGTIVTGDHCQKEIDTEDKEAYWRTAARVFKEKLYVPLILVGGIRSCQLAERLVDEGYADYISMSRPFIREPDLVNRWESGDLRKATCLSDNLCREPLMEGKGIYCVVEKKKNKEKQ
jgi:2,4-dienoyl-CoA reductase-like NADH-dependent reductase (Old Yellow Enzyme family)